MPTEQRIIASRGGAPARPAPGGAPAADTASDIEAKPKRPARVVLLVVGLVVVLGAAAGWYFLMGPGAGEAEGGETVAVEPEPEPGEVMTIEPISINLAGGSYLRIGVALQLTEDVSHEPEAAVALDHVIALFSGRPVEEVSSGEGREALRAELATQLEEAFHGDVMEVYLTDYVTQ